MNGTGWLPVTFTVKPEHGEDLMKRTLMAALAATVAMAAPMAYAQPDHDRDHRGDHGGDRGDYHRHDEWRKGYHMHQDDWARGRQIDWREHHLHKPPHGYEWREVDGNYVMAAVATGIIASVIANSGR
jgi:Ni/Co efflux regulator RcnB